MEPKKNCNICNRLVDYRTQNKILFPDFYNDRVLGIGSLSSELLIVGLAPELKGANRTGKVFNGDFSGNLLFNFLKKYNISKSYSEFEQIALNKNLSAYKFIHLKKHKINDQINLINCYHCSKYNINTKRLKHSDLDYIFKLIKKLLNF